MTTVSDILARKSGKTHCVSPRATVLEATRIMNDARIGSVLVIEGEWRRIVGILTERDLLTRVITAERDPSTTLVSDVMTTDVLFCTPSTTIDDLRSVMREKRIRHVPVREDDGSLVGLVSIGDLNAFESESAACTLASLTDYITRG